jgi:2-methylaconitate cis-trans-isomerase PrpF
MFFRLQDLPASAQVPGAARDKLIGSPDPYGKQIDGMGGATSSTSKAVILAKSSQPDHDVDYLFGQVAIDKAFVDWSGSCGNLSAAVGAFAISGGLVDASCVPHNGVASVRIWQANIRKTIIAHMPITDGAVQEIGDFELDGVAFPAAEVRLEFLDPADEGDGVSVGSMFPTGNLVDDLEVPGVGTLKATLINVGIPTVFVNADAIGYTGTEFGGHQRRRQGTCHVRNDSRLWRRAYGAYQAYRRSLRPPAHAQGGLCCAPEGLRVVERQGDQGR